MVSSFQGLKELRAELQNLPQQLSSDVDSVIGIGVSEMAATAKRLAPADQGLLRSQISASKIAELSWEFVSQVGYAGFLEFGTRGKVKIPAGAEAIAAEVRANKFKSSLSAKQTIYAWCKRKSIDPKLWFPIYRSIMVNGIEPRPSFFPAFEQGLPRIIRDVKSVIAKLLK